MHDTEPLESPQRRLGLPSSLGDATSAFIFWQFENFYLYNYVTYRFCISETATVDKYAWKNNGNLHVCFNFPNSLQNKWKFSLQMLSHKLPYPERDTFTKLSEVFDE